MEDSINLKYVALDPDNGTWASKDSNHLFLHITGYR